MNNPTKQERIQATIIQLCAMIAALENGIEHFDFGDKTIKPGSELISVKEAFAILNIPESALNRQTAQGDIKPVDLAALPILFDKAAVVALANSEG